MKLTKLVTIVASAALLAGCGGGGASGPPAIANVSSTPTNGVTTGLAIKVATGTTKGSSNRRSAKQITSDVTALLVAVDGIGTRYELSPVLSPACSGTSPNYTCDIAASAGSHSVDVTTQTGSGPYTSVGFSIPQDGVTITLGQVTPLSFTLTPVAASLSGFTTTPAAGKSLPEDGASHPVVFTLDVLAPSGDVISSPIDTQNLFGYVDYGTVGDLYTVPNTYQPPLSITGAYSDGPIAFTYDGAQISGDAIGVYGAYVPNATDSVADQVLVEQAYNALVTAPGLPPTTTVFSVPLTRLNLPPSPDPVGASIGGTTFDPTNSYYYYPPNNGSAPTVPEPNNSNTAVLVFNTGANTQYDFFPSETNDNAQMTFSGTCNTASGTGGPVYVTSPTAGSPNGSTPISIRQPSVSGQTVPCVLTIAEGSFPSLTQSLTVFPSPGSYAIYTQSIHRR